VRGCLAEGGWQRVVSEEGGNWKSAATLTGREIRGEKQRSRERREAIRLGNTSSTEKRTKSK